MTSRIAAGALGAGVVASVAVATLAATHADPSEVSPVVPAGGWNTVWVTSLVAALVVYVLGVVAVRRARLRVAVAVTIAVAVQSVTLAAPLLLSKDVYLYWGEARVVTAHGKSPYAATPSEFPDDPALPFVSEQWRAEPAPYGPVWEAMALAPAAAAGTSRRAAELGYRILAVLGVLAAVLVVAAGTRNAAQVALLGWSPLLALQFGGGGHSDGWIAALLALAVVAGRRPAGGAAWSIAAAMKPVPVVLVPLQLAARRLRMPRAWWLGLAIAAAAVVLLPAPFWGIEWIRTSLVGVRGSAPLGGVHWLTEAGLRHRDAVLVAGAAFAAVYAFLVRHAWRTGRARLSLAATALCLTSSLLRPWYGIWPLALAAAEEDGPAAAAAVALSAYLLLGDAVAL